MKFLDFYPCKGFYKIGEKIDLTIIVDERSKKIDGKITVYSLDEKIYECQFNEKVDNGSIVLSLDTDYFTYGGYIAELTDNIGNIKRTAFDILDSWLDFPRYGYVSNFTPNMSNTKEQIEKMAKYHVNGVQFYDWQYRHDDLLSDNTLYLDPFDREMSLDTVNSWIDECHSRQMVAMPYLAIYAASVEFWKKHKSWGMYDENNEPLMFEDFLGLVDPTFGSEWFNHLDNECNEVLEKTNFDGLHIDQYGEPKKAFDSNGKEIDIPKAFVDFINHQKDKNKGDVVFNAVGNWPIEDLAKSKADFMYIEVWDFTPTFKDLMQIAVNARKKSGQRPLVIPIYIKEKDFNNVLLADAVINAAGGTHLEIGDGEKLLSDPYFPKAEYIGDQQLAILRRYWDFVVGYQKVLGPNAVYVDTTAVVDEDIMTISRENENYKAINFINCSNKDKWTEHLEKPQKKENIEVLIPVNGEVTNLLYGSPDDEDYMLKPLEYEIYDGKVKAILPELNYWSMIIIEEN